MVLGSALPLVVPVDPDHAFTNRPFISLSTMAQSERASLVIRTMI